MYWANVAVVFKITILLLVTFLVSLNCPVTLGIIDRIDVLIDFQFNNFWNNQLNFTKLSGQVL